ncbi:hypothetical protein SCHPADRAFT_92608 [Schizopora paradoxa]|uniref:Oxidoreductase putative C-terminal domain-containing protein n=1 Tax=Schizopora paradoxa TaxID=27342 RepID=A0A0H2SB16_9AGAM|nr:hypothetical protein SCHPADRAFT_92608 [Schizopora paradoxa]
MDLSDSVDAQSPSLALDVASSSSSSEKTDDVANDFRVLFIGAGNVMFGSLEGPWNHSVRLEQTLGARLKVVALVDPDVKRCEETLKRKHATDAFRSYKDTLIYSNLEELFHNRSENLDLPRWSLHAIIIGIPPYFRGSSTQCRNTELKVIRHFPGVPLFIEKPVSVPEVGESDILGVFTIANAVRQNTAVCSVAYMLRYLKAVQMMKQIIEEKHLTIMATTARFACAYASIGKPDYWFKSRFGGPIMEQATHVCDLSRYFGGEIDLSSISANTVEYDETPGQLSYIDEKCLENQVAPDDKISRATVANWKYEDGAIGSLMHVVALHGDQYACDFEVIADGYMLRLVNPYVDPVLFVRRPGSVQEEQFTFPGDDPYLTEISSFVDAVDDPNTTSRRILSTYEDACQTYRFTWEIRCAAERSIASRRSKSKAI